jgi:hypothetical protein
MTCAIYTLAHGANFLICNKLFAIGKSTTLVLHEVVDVMNVIFKKLISWPNGVEIQVFMEDFKCGLPNVQGAIDGTHIIIFKPLTPYPKDYVYHKTKCIQLLHKLL